MKEKDVILSARGLRKYDALGSPVLSVAEINIYRGETVVLQGMDSARAEIFLHLLTGRYLPDEGEVSLFGVLTHTIQEVDDWIPHLEKMALLDPREPLMEEWPVEVSLLYPYAMDLSVPMDDDKKQNIREIAKYFGIRKEDLEQHMAEADALTRLRVHFVRSIAREPNLLFIMAFHDVLHPDYHSHLLQLLKKWKNRDTVLIFTDSAENFKTVADRTLTYDHQRGQFDIQYGRKRILSRLFR